MAAKKGGLGKGLNSLMAAPSSSAKKEASSKGSEKTVDGVATLKITQIEPDRSQPRLEFDRDRLEELAASVKEKGLIEPIIVQQEGEKYTIIAGERRWRACQIAGIKEVPVLIKEYTPQERFEISLIENIQREDLNPIEEAGAYRRLVEEFGLTQEEVAQKVSKSRTAVTNALRLLKLPENIQKHVISGELSMGHARALLAVEDPEVQENLALRIIAEQLSVREAEKIIRRLGKETKPKKKDETAEIFYRDLESRMNQSLGMKVGISSVGKNGGGKLQIEFASQDDLDKLMDLLIQG